MPDSQRLCALACTFVVACGAAPPPPPPPAPVVAQVEEPPPPPDNLAVLRESAVRYVDAFGNRDACLSPIGGQVAFLSNRNGGEYQLFIAHANDPASRPRLLVDTQDRISEVGFDVSGHYLYFLMDHDRNELRRLYRIPRGGGTPEVLFEGEGRVGVEMWHQSDDGEHLVITAGDQASGVFTTYVASSDGEDRRELLHRDGFTLVSDIDNTAAHVLIAQVESLSRYVTSLVDVGTGTVRRIGPREGVDARVIGAFAPEGRGIYLITDEGRERRELVRMERPGERRSRIAARYAPEQGEVDQVELSRDERTLAVQVANGSRSEIHLLDPVTLERRAVAALGPGAVGLGRFEGELVTVTYSNASTPTDIFAVNTTDGSARQLREDTRPGLADLTQLSFEEVMVPSFDGLEVPVQVYRDSANGDARGPVIIQFHGGPAAVAQSTWNPSVAFYAAQGFRIVAPNIRGSTGYTAAYERADNGPRRVDAFRDMEAVNRWTREQTWADPDRIVIYGGSYGGYLVYIGLTRQPDLWNAGVALVGPVNLDSFLRSTTGAIRLAFRDEFGDVDRDQALLRELSPIHALDALRAPLFVYQGENDPRVPQSESDQVVNALRERGRPVEYMIGRGEGHSASLRENRIELMARTVGFLRAQLEITSP